MKDQAFRLKGSLIQLISIHELQKNRAAYEEGLLN